MRGAAEFLAFLGVASGLHVLPWIGTDPGGAGAVQPTAEAVAPVSAATAELAALVEAWTVAPQITDRGPALAAPVADTPPMSLPVAAPAPARSTPVAPAAPMAQLVAPVPPAPQAALPVPQVQADPVALRPAPIQDRPALPGARANRPAPSAPPPALSPPPVASEAPVRIDPATAASPFAPLASSRPQSRPEGLAPPPPPVDQARPAAPAAQPSRPAAQATAPRAAPDAPAAPSGPSAAQVQAMMGEWGGRIRGAIEQRKRYPAGTRATGQVRLRLSVSTTGQLTALAIAASSGDAALDRAAVAAVQSARLPGAPRGMPGGSHDFTLSLSFRP